MINALTTFLNNITGVEYIQFNIFNTTITIYNTLWAYLMLFIVIIGFIIIWTKIILLPSNALHKAYHRQLRKRK